jgi:hypothetical protein
MRILRFRLRMSGIAVAGVGIPLGAVVGWRQASEREQLLRESAAVFREKAIFHWEMEHQCVAELRQALGR